jgi:fucose 4-O-acetylase-like acetyltransferase
LHVSKYPPSLAFAALELGIMFTLLAAAWRWVRPWKPLVVLGQTALFYYLIHAHLFKAGALALGIYKTQGLGTTVVGWGAMLVLLYPVCRWYLGVKRRHPHSVLRFV